MAKAETFTEEEIAKLDERRGRIVRKRQGHPALDYQDRQTFKGIAFSENMSIERARQLYWQGVYKLRLLRAVPIEFTTRTLIILVMPSVRLKNVCQRTLNNGHRGLVTLGDLSQITHQDFMSLKNAGKKTAAEAEALLAKAGLQFKQ